MADRRHVVSQAPRIESRSERERGTCPGRTAADQASIVSSFLLSSLGHSPCRDIRSFLTRSSCPGPSHVGDETPPGAPSIRTEPFATAVHPYSHAGQGIAEAASAPHCTEVDDCSIARGPGWGSHSGTCSAHPQKARVLHRHIRIHRCQQPCVFGRSSSIQTGWSSCD